MPYRLQQAKSWRTVKVAYLTAFSLIALIVFINQGIVQLALSQEVQTRQAARLLTDQEVRSQRIQRNAILFLTPGSHVAQVTQMQSDVSGMEANARRFLALYVSQYPSVATPKTRATYVTVVSDAKKLIVLEQGTFSNAEREKQELPIIRELFYAENDQLTNIQHAIDVVGSEGDTYVARIQLTEVLLFVLTLLVLLIEGVVVLRPVIQYFDRFIQLQLEAYRKEHPES